MMEPGVEAAMISDAIEAMSLTREQLMETWCTLDCNLKLAAITSDLLEHEQSSFGYRSAAKAIYVLDLTHLDLRQVVALGRLPNVHTIIKRNSFRANIQEFSAFNSILRNLPSLKTVRFEGDLNDNEDCTRQFIAIRWDRNPHLDTVHINYTDYLRRSQTWISSLMCAWRSNGANTLTHEVHACEGRSASFSQFIEDYPPSIRFSSTGFFHGHEHIITTSHQPELDVSKPGCVIYRRVVQSTGQPSIWTDQV